MCPEDFYMSETLHTQKLQNAIIHVLGLNMHAWSEIMKLKISNSKNHKGKSN